jgi:hypothetical protein
MADGTSQRRIRIARKWLGAREVISRQIQEFRRLASMDANADQLKAPPEFKYPSNT